jgi:hypothetical protein
MAADRAATIQISTPASRCTIHRGSHKIDGAGTASAQTLASAAKGNAKTVWLNRIRLRKCATNWTEMTFALLFPEKSS